MTSPPTSRGTHVVSGPHPPQTSHCIRASCPRVSRCTLAKRTAWHERGRAPGSDPVSGESAGTAVIASSRSALLFLLRTVTLLPGIERSRWCLRSTESQASRQNAERAYLRIAFMTLLIVVTAVTLGVAAVAWLIRSVLGRILTYSEFTSKVSAGELGGELN